MVVALLNNPASLWSAWVTNPVRGHSRGGLSRKRRLGSASRKYSGSQGSRGRYGEDFWMSQAPDGSRPVVIPWGVSRRDSDAYGCTGPICRWSPWTRGPNLPGSIYLFRHLNSLTVNGVGVVVSRSLRHAVWLLSLTTLEPVRVAPGKDRGKAKPLTPDLL